MDSFRSSSVPSFPMIFMFLIFWVSYAVSNVKIKTPAYDVIQYKVSLPMNMFTRDAIINPKTPINKMFPRLVKSVLVKYP